MTDFTFWEEKGKGENEVYCTSVCFVYEQDVKSIWLLWLQNGYGFSTSAWYEMRLTG